MANKKFWLVMLVMVLAFGMMVVGCGEEPYNDDSPDTEYNNLSTPAGVTATALSSSSISVSWSAVSGAASYDVYYEIGYSSEKIFAGNTASTSYTHTGLQPSTTYWYYIKAKNSAGESGYSSSEFAATQSSSGGISVPSAPTGVTATALSSSSIFLSWSPVSGATSYDVYYEVGSSTTKNFAGNVTGTSYTHTGLQSGTTYYYYIKAKNSAGESGYSSSKSATTQSSNSNNTAAGYSSSTAITIPSGGSMQGSIPSGWDSVWYKFTKNGSGKLYAKDKEDGFFSPYTGDIVIDVYDSNLQLIYVNGTIPLSNIDVGSWSNFGDNLVDFVSLTNWGTCYVKVKPKNNSSANKGTFELFVP